MQDDDIDWGDDEQVDTFMMSSVDSRTPRGITPEHLSKIW